MKWYWISTSYATFAVAECDGIIKRAAPIAKWAIGKHTADVLSYYRRKRGTMIRDLPKEEE